MTLRWFGLLVILVTFAACDRRVEPWVDVEDELPAPERPVKVPGLQPPDARSPMVLDRPPESAAVGDGIRGVVRLEQGTPISPGSVVFVIARGQGQGPPLAVKRLPAGPFPLAFEIGPEDMMIEGSTFTAPIYLGARVDADGNASTREREEPSGIVPRVLQPGVGNVEIVLRHAAGVPAASAVPVGAPSVRGVIRLGEGAPPPATGRTLFLVARKGQGGPPLAVQRLTAGPFPLSFEIGPRDIMIPGRTFEGPMTLSARIDTDGDASTRSSGELAGVVREVGAGAGNVEIVLRPTD